VTNVIVFHHILGVTEGVREFSDRLRAAGHEVAVPDLFDGQAFASREAGRAYVEQTGIDTIVERGLAAAELIPLEAVYVGFSLGTLPAQILAQTRPGARGAVLCYGFTTPTELGSEWPASLPVQIHAMEDDALARDAVADGQKFVESAAQAELFLYHGAGHLFADRSSGDFDEEAADLLIARVGEFLTRG
jgi:dienelactone hydrolase